MSSSSSEAVSTPRSTEGQAVSAVGSVPAAADEFNQYLTRNLHELVQREGASAYVSNYGSEKPAGIAPATAFSSQAESSAARGSHDVFSSTKDESTPNLPQGQFVTGQSTGISKAAGGNAAVKLGQGQSFFTGPADGAVQDEMSFLKAEVERLQIENTLAKKALHPVADGPQWNRNKPNSGQSLAVRRSNELHPAYSVANNTNTNQHISSSLQDTSSIWSHFPTGGIGVGFGPPRNTAEQSSSGTSPPSWPVSGTRVPPGGWGPSGSSVRNNISPAQRALPQSNNIASGGPVRFPASYPAMSSSHLANRFAPVGNSNSHTYAPLGALGQPFSPASPSQIAVYGPQTSSMLAYSQHDGFGGNSRASHWPQAQHLGVPQAQISHQSALSPARSPSRLIRPIGTPLSPTAAEFRVVDDQGTWNRSTQITSTQNSVYEAPSARYTDPRLSSDWKTMIEKIICNNDQQASIFLQQKVRQGSEEQKHVIIEATIGRCYQLMVNRFGNFLVQRCLEHGSPEQIIAITNTIRGHTSALSQDAFACHVVQKAFECAPEEYKTMMIHELLQHVKETVVQRYSCHVWQKLFELRWNGPAPQIMKYVNQSLWGMWHEVALGETGSLVVQNVFENCLEEDKRQAVDEVLHHIDVVARGQFGNWCIQHICEHGSPQDRSRAIDHIIVHAIDYSMDQFASKVIEKCLKNGGNEFLDRYLAQVCKGQLDRPRLPLIDIASDQYGNYLVQWILTNGTFHSRELVSSHVRRHLVSLRGSKYGARVGMLCSNGGFKSRPAIVSPPGSHAGPTAIHHRGL